MFPIILWTAALLLLASAFIGCMFWLIDWVVKAYEIQESVTEMVLDAPDPHIVRLADFARDNRRPSVRSGGASLGHSTALAASHHGDTETSR